MKVVIDWSKPFRSISSSKNSVEYVGKMEGKGEFCHLIHVGAKRRPLFSDIYGYVIGEDGKPAQEFAAIEEKASKFTGLSASDLKDIQKSYADLEATLLAVSEELQSARDEIRTMKGLFHRHQEQQAILLKQIQAANLKAQKDQTDVILLSVDSLTSENKTLIETVMRLIEASQTPAPAPASAPSPAPSPAPAPQAAKPIAVVRQFSDLAKANANQGAKPKH